MPLFLVSTPIGNLGDMTFRAVEVLRAADVIFAEDTRRTGVLLKHFEIEGKMVSAHEHNEAARAELAVEILGEGRDVALVTDAGTPLLSDPGARIVRRVIEAGHPVVPVPGASALLAALAGSGLAADRFTFLGFIPRKGGDRKRLLEEIARSPYTSVLYESPHRLHELVADLAEAAGADREVVVARELTKLHEEFARGTAGELRDRLRDLSVRGEVVVLVAGAPEAEPDAEAEDLAARTLAEALLAQGVAPSRAAKELAKRLSISRNEAYELVQRITTGSAR